MANYEIRDVTDSDHEWLVELHNDPTVLYNITDPSPITLESHMKWWKSLDPKKQIRRLFTIDGKRAGFIKIYNVDRNNKNCVLGADLHKDFRGQGHAKPMWTAMINYCFEELDMHRVAITTAEYNTVGHKVYGGIGFKDEGRLVQSLYRDGKFFDQICMYLLRDDWKK